MSWGDMQSLGPDTYLNGHAHGWPTDHKAEDTYEAPPYSWEPTFPGATVLLAEKATRDEARPTIAPVIDYEYVAEFNIRGEALLIKRVHSDNIIAKFDTYADAQLAAEALNNHEGR